MVAFIVDPVGTTFMCFLYMFIGFISVICNLLNLTVYLSEKKFRQKYVFFIVLELGELVNAISYLVVGLGRLMELHAGRLIKPHSITECFYNYPWPVLLIAGMELTSFTIFFLSIERICAVAIPIVFKKVFFSPVKWIFITIIPLLTMGSIALGAQSALGKEKETNPTGHCGIITSTALWYSTFHFVMITAAYVISFSSTLLVWHRFKSIPNHRTRKLFVNLVLIGVTAILIAIPSFINIAVRFDWITVNDIPYALGYSLPGFVSIANTIISFGLRPDLRDQLLFIFLKRYPEICLMDVFGCRQHTAGFNDSYSTHPQAAVAPKKGSTPPAN